jgi:SAM-dependent methyltransferase
MPKLPGVVRGWIHSAAPCQLPRAVPPPVTVRLRSLSDYEEWSVSTSHRFPEITAFDSGSVKGTRFAVPGRCQVCDRATRFLVNHHTSHDGSLQPSWREGLTCPYCGLNRRMRFAASVTLSTTRRTNRIYLTEATTPLFRALRTRRPLTTGSEFLRDGTTSGTSNRRRIRHEDITRLSFDDCSFGLIGTFDVLEHVPDYQRALGEFARCLDTQGHLVISVPFLLSERRTLVRAYHDPEGRLVHLVPPEIHGDPMSAEGALCYYHFGWELLDDLRRAGFEDAVVQGVWDPSHGYLGGLETLILARKSGRIEA